MELMAITKTVLAPFAREWVTLHQQISPHVLVTFLTSALISFGNQLLSEPVVVPTWEVILKKGGKEFNWQALL
jgi:hypothetical protein